MHAIHMYINVCNYYCMCVCANGSSYMGLVVCNMVIHSMPWESKHTSPSSVATLRVLMVTVKARCSIEVVSLASGIFPEHLNTKLPCEMSMCISTAQARTKQWPRD